MDVFGGGNLLEALPPLPKPDYRRMRGEACVGCVSVLTVIISIVTGTHVGAYLVLAAKTVPAIFPYALVTAVYVEAFIAVCCLAGIMFGDPGVIQRTEQSCSPLPEAVRELILKGQALESLKANLVSGERTYCVRCLVWRDERQLLSGGGILQQHGCRGCPEGKKFHHCSTCQRCVAKFDHHCGFFGRCIAGQGFSGNMGYFKVIVATGNLGCLTGGSSLLLGLSQSRWGYWVFVAVICYIALVSFVGLVCLLVQGIFLLHRRWRPKRKLKAVPTEDPGEGARVIGAAHFS